MKIKAVKLVVALTASGRTGAQSAILDLDNPSDRNFVESMTWDGARGGLIVQLAGGKGLTSKRPEPGQPGDRLFVPAARVEYVVEVPDPAPEAKKAKP